MKKIIVVIVLMVSIFGYSQKVKLKKGNVIIDEIEVYKYDSEGSTTSLSKIDGEEFVSILSTSYEVPNPNKSMPGGHNLPATIKRFVYTVRFIDSGKELYTDNGVKDVIKAIYKAELFSEDGNIDELKIDKFINKYNNETLKLKIN